VHAHVVGLFVELLLGRRRRRIRRGARHQPSLAWTGQIGEREGV
jgi:hypothetical protein